VENSHGINNARAINATKTTSRLNRSIRPSYTCVQLIFLSFTGVLFAVLANPLAFIGFHMPLVSELIASDTAANSLPKNQIYRQLLI
jgi:hypothetical protein